MARIGHGSRILLLTHGEVSETDTNGFLQVLNHFKRIEQNSPIVIRDLEVLLKTAIRPVA